MINVKTISLFLFAISSVCVGATLMHHSIIDFDTDTDIKTPTFLGESPSCEHEAACQRLIHAHHPQDLSSLGKVIYAEALVLGLSDQHPKAKEAAECAAHFALGQHGWRLEQLF